MKALMRNGRDRRSANPFVGHARKERVLLIGTDQRITSEPAARTAAPRGRIHGCTRIVSRKVRFFSLAPRAPSIHGTKCWCRRVPVMTVIEDQRTQGSRVLRRSKSRMTASRRRLERNPRTAVTPDLMLG